MTRTFKTIVCGTRFGENYISALLEGGTGFELTGILARGSARSRKLSEDLMQPLYYAVEDLPEDLDVACVALRSSAFGGPGDKIAEALLRRGINVVQEHPVHPTEIRRLLAIASDNGVAYQVNSFYGHSAAGCRFIDFAGQWLTNRRPHYLTITTSPQLLYSSLDIVGRAFGGLEDFHIASPRRWPDGCLDRAVHGTAPFQVLQGQLQGVPLILHLQNYLDPRDPDHHSLVMHNIVLGGPEGRIELVNSFGPVVWTHAIYMPDYDDDGSSASYLGNWASKEGNRFMTQPTALTMGDANGPSLKQAGLSEFPEIILRAMNELRQQMTSMDDQPFSQSASYLDALGSAWRSCMIALGPMVEIDLPVPPSPVPDPKAFAAKHNAVNETRYE